MGFLAFALGCLATLPLAAPFTIPSPSSINSSITLLYYDDVDVYTASEHRSVLLLSPMSQSDAVTACAGLAETLLPIKDAFFATELVPLLQYQLYWVESAGETCQAVDSLGLVSTVSCDSKHPILCSQSAAYGASAAANNSIIVYADDLTVIGYRDQLSFRFEGIPYADHPERFTYPTAYTGSKTLNATAFGSECVQAGVPSGSEDCLFLNIWTPYIPLDGLKPVMFWIHGGAFIGGTGSDPMYAGSNMAARGDVVLVTIIYRLSILDFLALDDGVTNGNFGIADQVAALDRVREYITAFGGDPDRITIFGQSAGAASVLALLASPPAIGKYAAVVSMSNLAGSDYATRHSLYYTISEEVSEVVYGILEETGCTTDNALESLRAYDAYDLVSLSNVARFIVVEGTYVTHTELPLNGSGTVANVHAMMGHMRDDGAAFIGYPTTTNLTSALLAQDLPTTVVNDMLFEVPTGPNATYNIFNVTARVATDVEFRCLEQATVWFYQFNRSYQTPEFEPNYPVCHAPITAEYPYGDPSMEYFKCHAGELYYVFGTLPTTLPYRDDQDLPFMQRTLDIWTTSARTYNPNPDSGYLTARCYNGTLARLAEQSTWEPVTTQTLTSAPLRTLQWDGFMGPFAEQEQCDFLSYPLDYFG
ncbi:carboxylesterase from carbohydrate esterase [Laetiporus sulphureus 93-53]|uniref:Carboxylic ester hydrolase n=1 Tax=Laetiporus sulphureus 93-53 TaxID=1314785 RepID=A0A165DDJ9_9APHY|nr:carboxylesterase from carbohydrate esterase [Laetiporus sulphureus 93-53]KZT04637.1 carboxylesterase from carbohydrate esterase [Laetiporus sulphureus 93-53]